MDFHTLSRKELQTLCKKNKIPANLTNVAMAKALAALDTVDGIEEFLNRPESESPRTTGRTATRRNPVKHPESSHPLTRTRRATARKAAEETDQENKDVNVPLQTPAVPITRRRAQAASTRRKLDVGDEENEKNEEVKYDDVQSTQKKKAASAAARRGHSTRQSVRVLERTMAELKLTEPIKMDEETLEEGTKEKIEEDKEESRSYASARKSTEKDDAVALSEDLVLETHKANVEEVSHKETEVAMNDDLKGEEHEAVEDEENSIKEGDKKCNDEDMYEFQEDKGDCEENHECMKVENVPEKDYEIVRNENIIKEADEESGDSDDSALKGEIEATPMCDDLREDYKVSKNESSMEEADEVIEHESSMEEADEVIEHESSMEEADENEVFRHENYGEEVPEKCKGVDKAKGGDYENVPEKEIEVLLENLEEEHEAIKNESSIERADENGVVKNESSMEKADENEVIKNESSIEGANANEVNKNESSMEEADEKELVKGGKFMEEAHENCKSVDKAKSGDYENVLEKEIGVSMENLEEQKVDEKCNSKGEGEGSENVMQDETKVPIIDNSSMEEEADEKCSESVSVLENDYDGKMEKLDLEIPILDSHQHENGVEVELSESHLERKQDMVEEVVVQENKMESNNAAPAEEGSMVVNNVMSSDIPAIQTDEVENEILIDVEVTESEDFATEAHKCHPSAQVHETTETDSLYDVHITPEVEFAGEIDDLPPPSPNKTLVIQKMEDSLSHSSPFANKGLTGSPLAAERLPQISCQKSSAKRESTLTRTTNVSDNKENLGKSVNQVEQDMDKENKKEIITKGNTMSLDDKSLRQLTKMLKEKLALPNSKKDISQAGKARQALQALPSNNVAAKETETN